MTDTPSRNAIHWTPSATRRRSRRQRIVHREGKPLVQATRFGATVLIVAERIDIKALVHLPMVAQSPLMVRLPSAGVAAIFRYGAVAFFAEETGDREWLMASIGPASHGGGDPLAEEKATVIIDPEAHEGPVGNEIHLHAADRDRLQLLAEVMSKAAMLSFQERRSAGEFDRIEPLAQDLADDGRFWVRSQDLMRAVGNMLLSEHRLTNRAEVMDKPELRGATATWKPYMRGWKATTKSSTAPRRWNASWRRWAAPRKRCWRRCATRARTGSSGNRRPDRQRTGAVAVRPFHRLSMD